jgi:hypothetical protein
MDRWCYLQGVRDIPLVPGLETCNCYDYCCYCGAGPEHLRALEELKQKVLEVEDRVHSVARPTGDENDDDESDGMPCLLLFMSACMFVGINALFVGMNALFVGLNGSPLHYTSVVPLLW